MPIDCSTMASRPAVTCSPVATTASYSRASCRGEASRTQATSWLVTPGHGRDHDRHLVAGVDLALDVARDVADALDVGDRRAAELHHQKRHDDPLVCPRVLALAARVGARQPRKRPLCRLDARTLSHKARAPQQSRAAVLTGSLGATRQFAMQQGTTSAALRRRSTPPRSTVSRGLPPNGGTRGASSAPCTGSGRRGSPSCATRCCATSAARQGGMRPLEGLRVLDVGCGGGLISRAADPPGRHA